MLSKDLELTLNITFKKAREQRHEYMTVEHLLLGLLDNKSALSALQACGADVDIIRAELIEFIDDTTPLIPVTDTERETQPTLGFQRVLQRAVFQVQSSGKQEVSGANVIVAIFSEQESQAVYILKQYKVARVDIVNYLSHGITKLESEQVEEFEEDHDEDFVEDDELYTSKKEALENFTINLNEKAKNGEIDPLVGRFDEIERTIQILCRRRKNNPLFVGEAGVGKTALAEGLATRIVAKDVPEILADATVFSLDLGSLLAGTKYRGDFEKRFKAVIGQLKNHKGAVLFIDEIHSIIGAGAASGGVMDASNLIKPLLSSGELRCIGSTTYEEFRGIFEKDHALARRFQKIDVEEPSVEETIEILKGLKTYYEKYHNVKYSIDALKAAVELSDRYITDRKLPDKAIDVIDEVAASLKIANEESDKKQMIGVGDVEVTVAKMARIPQKSVTASDKELLKNIDRNLRLLIYGQDDAINALSVAIKLSRSGLGEPKKPVGAFLFTGPTGVGKTEVTTQLSNLMGIPLLRFDMSEYMEAHTISRLIGAPPGYVGFDKGGLLTEAVYQHPHAVVLLDEIEKAHPDVFNLLLQVMDHGTLTDTNGRHIDFRNVILVMTTNVGATDASRNSVGFAKQDHATDSMIVLNRTFSPEFRNRLSAVIQFKPLETDVIDKVVDKFVVQLQAQLEEKNVGLKVDDKARAWLSKNGYNKNMGARPMARLIEEEIKRPLAEELLFGKLMSGGQVTVTEKDDQLNLKIRVKKASTKSSKS